MVVNKIVKFENSVVHVTDVIIRTFDLIYSLRCFVGMYTRKSMQTFEYQGNIYLIVTTLTSYN